MGMCCFLSEWTELFPYDFRDERMMKHLRDITQRIVAIYPELRKEVGNLMHNLFNRVGYGFLFLVNHEVWPHWSIK